MTFFAFSTRPFVYRRAMLVLQQGCFCASLVERATSWLAVMSGGCVLEVFHRDRGCLEGRGVA